MNVPRHSRSAFTLIELLTVIAIVGILAAVIIPTVGKVRETAQRTVDANNLREIVKAAQLYAADNNDRLPDPLTIRAQFPGLGQGAHAWAGALAQRGILTDPTLYFAKNDPQFNGVYPTAIVSPSSRSSLDSSFENRVLSYEFVGGLRMSDGANVPVAFTRGLLATGLWSAENGAYRDAGGHIAFLGGNIQFFANTADADTQFTLNNGRKGSSVLQALPFNANASLNPRVYGTAPAGVGTPAGAPAERAP